MAHGDEMRIWQVTPNLHEDPKRLKAVSTENDIDDEMVKSCMHS